MLNKSGHSIDPWGTPYITAENSLYELFILLYFLSER